MSAAGPSVMEPAMESGHDTSSTTSSLRNAETSRPCLWPSFIPDRSSVQGAVEAAQQGLMAPTLVGPRERIVSVAAECGFSIADYPIVDTPFSEALRQPQPSNSRAKARPKRS